MKILITFFISVISLFTIFSCGEDVDCDCNEPPVLRPITAEEELVVASSNDFAFDIFARINTVESGKNLFISPLSISTALSMTANGAAGETKNGIKETLHQNVLSDQEINEAYKGLASFLLELDPRVTMNLANSNWYDQKYNIEENFKIILHDYYDAEVMAADFSNPGTKDIINGWIEDKTNGKIREMLDAIPSDAVMYLINAIYLKATWQYQFDKEKTEKGNFYLQNGNIVQTEMMLSEGVKTKFLANEHLQYIELPYGNGQFVFSIILPNDSEKLDEIINGLDSRQFNELVAEADSSTYQVYLPKFMIEYKITLNAILAAMGMEQSFGIGGNANFSNLFAEDMVDLYISRVLHQSFLEVDEEGAEAAAATIVEVSYTSAGPGSKPTLTINKPFAFFIREKHSETIIFSGKLVNPTK